MKSVCPDTSSVAPTKTVVPMPSLRNACAEVTNTPVVSSDATCLRSNASSLAASASRCAAERFVARISCAHSRNSCTPSAEARVLHRLRLALLVLPGERHHEQRRGHHPERRERQTPVVEEDADDDDGRGQARAEQLRHDVHEHALLVGAVLHDGVREVGQVAPPEERQRQPAQVLGQVGALAGALLVHLVVRVRVLGPLGEDHEREDADAPREVRRQRGQRGPRHEVVHEVAHQQEQDADRGHEHEVRQRAEEHAAPEVLRAHVGEAQGITQHSRPPFRCAIAPRFDSRPTCARTSRPPPPARRGSPAPRGGRRPARRWRRRRPRWTAGARS